MALARIGNWVLRMAQHEEWWSKTLKSLLALPDTISDSKKTGFLLKMESWQICSQMMFRMCLECKSNRWPPSQEERKYIFVNHHSPITNTCPANPPTPFGQFSLSVMSNSLLVHGLQHNRLPCPSPTPRACSNSCPSSRWCHPTISSSSISLLLLPSVFSSIKVFPNVVSSLHQVAKVL